MKYVVEHRIVTEFETDDVSMLAELAYTAIANSYDPYVFSDNIGNVKDINEVITLTDANGNRVMLPYKRRDKNEC